MAKIYGLFGAMTGKLADTVMSVRNGEQLARKYQPVVFNPSTPAQVAQRAKLKLMSQLSAVMAPVIAIPRQGAVSARNLFTKKNFGLTTYSEPNADVNLTSIQLTSSVVALPSVDLSTSGGNLVARLAEVDPSLDVDRMVYCIFEVQDDNRLRYMTSYVQQTAGADGRYQTTVDVDASKMLLLAYGVRDNSEAAKAKFADMTVVDATWVGRVVTSRIMTETDITLTETRGAMYTSAASMHSAPAGVEEDENRSKKSK